MQTWNDTIFFYIHFIDECPGGGGAFRAEEWFHLAGTFNGEKLKIYVNGKEIASVIASSAPVADTDAPLQIGQSRNMYFLTGIVDEVAIYNRALTSEEIILDMENGVYLSVEPLDKLSTTWAGIKVQH